jgi:hypothetical protein
MRSKDWIKGALFGFGLTAIAGMGVGAIAHERGGGGKQIAVDKAVVQQGIDSALQELAKIEKINDRNRDSRTRSRIHNGIHDLRVELQALETHVDAAPSIDLDPRDHDRDRDRGRDQDRWYDNDDYDDYGRQNHVSYTMSESEIDAIVMSMGLQISSSSKLAIVREGVSGRWITVTQLGRLMDELSYSADRVDCAASLHANVSDPQNFYQVYNHLPFEADRDTLRVRIGK